MEKITEGSLVNTPYGRGKVVMVEHYNRLNGGINRYGVELESNPFTFPVVCFFEDEVEALPC